MSVKFIFNFFFLSFVSFFWQINCTQNKSVYGVTTTVQKQTQKNNYSTLSEK